MVPAKIAVVALSAAWPALAVSAATMRRENPSKSEAAAAALFTSSGSILSAHDQAPPQHDWCDDDFPLGEPKTNCRDFPRERTLKKTECEEARIEAGASYKNEDANEFQIEPEFYHTYPKGCFAKTEEAGCGPNGVCYYYNECEGPQCPEVHPDGEHDGSQITEGNPVCKRVKIEYGTPGASDGCPDGYDNIKDETTCGVLAACSKHCNGGTHAVSGGTHFEINLVNESNYHYHPKWCFINTDGCAYFNKPLEVASGTAPDPQHSAGGGKPLCNVSTITDYSGATSQSISAPPMAAETYEAAHAAGVITLPGQGGDGGDAQAAGGGAGGTA